MKQFLKWAAIIAIALISLSAFSGASEATQFFIILAWAIGYCYFALAKQIQRNHEAVVRRLDVLFGLARKDAGFHDDQA